MKRVSFLLKVKQDLVEEYKRTHADMWPEMLDALRRSGWRSGTLFISEDGLLFGCFEVDESLNAVLAKLSREEVNRRWQERMAPFFEIPPGARPDQALVELEEVFHLA
jgi:L-rhamnose mutarotase